jgi:hypothetical protein
VAGGWQTCTRRRGRNCISADNQISLALSDRVGYIPQATERADPKPERKIAMKVGEITGMRYTVSHPVALQPEDVLSFLHHPQFTQDWHDLGLDDDDLAELELCIMATPRELDEPDCVNLIHVFPEPRDGRPSFRAIVGYVHFRDQAIAALLAADGPDAGVEITDEDRQILRMLMAEIKAEIEAEIE